jgi:hypothetical protein
MPTLSELLSSNQLSGLDHATLYRLREQAKAKSLQNLLAGYEHRAFAREAVTENPWLALPIATATPLYQLAKMSGLMPGRSAPSMGQMGSGLLGVGEGILGALRRR